MGSASILTYNDCYTSIYIYVIFGMHQIYGVIESQDSSLDQILRDGQKTKMSILISLRV